jgi:hypothetical protein
VRLTAEKKYLTFAKMTLSLHHHFTNDLMSIKRISKQTGGCKCRASLVCEVVGICLGFILIPYHYEKRKV